jgi:translation initiation factor IF-3
VPTDEARRLAEEAGLDLVEVAPNARPPVCRIMDFGKFKYRQKKSAQKSRHHQSQLKEIRVRPKIGEHDLKFKLDRAREFLQHGDKVQVNLLFRGREMVHQEVAHALLHRVAETLADIAKVEVTPRIEGRRLSMLLTKK